MEIRIHPGELLLLLVRRSKKEVRDVAKMLDITPTSLSRMFNSKKLSKKVKEKAAALFGIPAGYFDDIVPGDSKNDELVRALKEENEKLQVQIKQLNQIIIETESVAFRARQEVDRLQKLITP